MAGIKGVNYRFTDQEFDGGTGLYYYDARYYDPMLGRFVQPDMVLDGLNRYAYCKNDPVVYIDPLGMFGSHTTQKDCEKYYDNYEERNKPNYLNASSIRSKAESIQRQLNEIAKKVVTDEEFRNRLDTDTIFEALDYFFDDIIGVDTPDGLVLFSANITAFSSRIIGAGLGCEVILTRGHGVTIYGQAGAGLGKGVSMTFGAGLVWGLNGDPTKYTGGFIDVQISLTGNSSVSACWWNPIDPDVFGFKAGYSIGKKTYGVLIEYYFRVYDTREGYFPDIPFLHDMFGNFLMPD
ncbi:MAG: RHS repeat-associated core domain-containing protein [Spirochaetales bacterium]|nr:RHS repeat-associated core domain-containing protein [Spirochaetales bacterium]